MAGQATVLALDIHNSTFIFNTQVSHPCISVVSCHSQPSPVAPLALQLFLLAVFSFSLGCPASYSTQLTVKVILTLIISFCMYLARVSKKIRKKKSKQFYSIVQMCFSYYFNVITSSNLILLPLLQLVLKYAQPTQRF